VQRAEILGLIREALAEISDNDDLSITEASTPDSTPGWDSVNHMKLLFYLEELEISFEVSELTLPANMGALVDMIQAKQAR
jgi:acyl carrier protein